MDKLSDAICDYLKMMALSRFRESTFIHHSRALRSFYRYVSGQNIDWNKALSDQTVNGFLEICPLRRAASVIRSFSKFLYYEKRIDKPIGKYHPILPDIFNQYLTFKASVQSNIYCERIVLTGFAGYLDAHEKHLKAVRIKDVDCFLSGQYGYLSIETQNSYKTCLRVFLRYLYIKKVIRKNLAPLIVNRRVFAMAKPPRFLRPVFTKKLFGSLKHTTPRDLRTNAMLYLAYTLGLRPKEISRIKLDDISFKTSAITLRERKNCNPVVLPLPEDAVKAIAAYIIGARPDTSQRVLFLYLKPDYKPLTGNHVAREISACMKRAGLSSSYWLRHTYAQNLLEKDVSIFEIKEMMGHENIQTTRKYLHINIKLMREALFNEEI